MSFLSDLNKAQQKAVGHTNGPLLVIAGAGSGKTKALTHRVAHLIAEREADPSNILAVTFTNKAAREMKERLELLLAKNYAENKYAQSWSSLDQVHQRQIRSNIYQSTTKDLWIGTFHAIFARLLRFDIDKYLDPEGLSWTKQFSIYDESDSLNLVKEIITQELQLDPKRFEPKKARWSISKAKNYGWTADQLEKEFEGHNGKLSAELYRRYRRALAANNALDFDDLLLLPVQLLQQNEAVRNYWHSRFRHILVDEYQDTNRTQYELLKLLTTNGVSPKNYTNWKNRSIFVVGDADQSIYSFRAADFTILMGFQDDFKNHSQENKDKIMVKLEDNYRSTSTILKAANSLIENNKERIDKVLKATREEGELIKLTRCDDEISEAEAVIHRLRLTEANNYNLKWGDMAILYRTNAQSRAIEESLVRWGIPYVVVGGLRFYDRREIKDILAYLKLLVNKNDSLSLLRIINVPRRGIGKTTIQRLTDASSQLGIPLWEIVTDTEAVRSLAGRSAKGIFEFTQLIESLDKELINSSPSIFIQKVMERCGYLNELIAEATEEAEERRQNLQELVNAAIQFEDENEESDVSGFLASAALASDADKKDTEADRVTLMTLHSSKGLEFPAVCIVGLEQGLFPGYRSLSDPSALEEERRLCYVGITRAKEQLFLFHANERRLWGGMREPAVPSIFLSEIPEELIKGDLPLSGGTSLRRQKNLPRLTRIDRKENTSSKKERSFSSPSNAIRRQSKEWNVGDHLIHNSFGKGVVTHLFGSNERRSIAVKFDGMGPKIIDPRLAPIESINEEQLS